MFFVLLLSLDGIFSRAKSFGGSADLPFDNGRKIAKNHLLSPVQFLSLVLPPVTMLRSAFSISRRTLPYSRTKPNQQSFFASKAGGGLEADSGALSTRAHHAMTTSLAIVTPIFFLVPDSMSDGTFNKMFGLALSVNIAAHSWIGLNYVATDYVPKISKALLGPARIANAALATVTLLGLARISLNNKGGIK